jgi:Kef-type K+ transport system membrane component KefB
VSTRCDAKPIPNLDYSDLAIAVAAAAAAPLIVDLLPLPNVPPIVTEIFAGILIGPQVLDIVRVSAPLEVFSQIGLVFLFFLAGLELTFDGGTSQRHLRIIGIAFAVSLALAIVVALVFDAAGLSSAPTLVAIMLAATSFGIVVAVLKDAGELTTPFGQTVIAGASIADFATVILLSLFFSNEGSGAESTVVLLTTFALLAATVGLVLAGARGSPRLRAAVGRLQRTSAQISVRLAFVLLVAFVLMADEFGLEVVLGAFLAGAILSFLDPERAIDSSGLKDKLDGIGFGIFIPIFFVVSGVRLDLESLFSSFDTIVLVPATVAALLVVRGLPALLYRRFVERHEAIAAGLMQATSLSFLVAATQIGVELDKIDEAVAAGIVGGGVISVLIFPALALRILARVRTFEITRAKEATRAKG